MHTLAGVSLDSSDSSDWVRSVTFSLDDKRVVSGSDDGSLKIWDIETGAEVSSHACTW